MIVLTNSHDTQLWLSKDEVFAHEGIRIRCITVIPCDVHTQRPLTVRFEGPYGRVLAHELHYDEVFTQVPGHVRGAVLKVIDRYITQGPVLDPAPPSKGLGRRLGKGHWSR